MANYTLDLPTGRIRVIRGDVSFMAGAEKEPEPEDSDDDEEQSADG